MASPAPQHDPVDHASAHVLAKVGLRFADDGGGSVVTLDPAPVLLGADGHLSFGALGILFDLASSTALDRASFRPFVHADISVHRLHPATGPLVATPRVLRQGGRTGVVEIELRDRAGTVVATSSQEIVFKGDAREPTPEMVKLRNGFQSMFDGTCRLTQPLETELGIVQQTPGVWSLAQRRDRTNGFGGLHGGTAITLVDVAASGTMTDRWEAPAQTLSASVRYLAPAMVGPFLAEPAVWADAGSHAVVRVPVVDAGADDRLVIVAEVHVIR